MTGGHQADFLRLDRTPGGLDGGDAAPAAAQGGDLAFLDDIDAEGVGRLDVRGTLETDDGAKIYVQYPGVLVMNEKVQAALAGGGETAFGDTYFMTQPRFETGDPNYAWLNSVVAVAEGRALPGAVEYRVYQVC